MVIFNWKKRTQFICGLLAFLMLISVFTAFRSAQAASAIPDYGLKSNVQDGVILHCWNWSYNNIKSFIPQIAAAGYSAVQTSPVTQPKDFYYQGVSYSSVGTPNGQGGNDGNWWKLYQPVSMNICDNGMSWLGTKAEFQSMCDAAHQYGVKVIVDIVANHMANIKGWQNALSDVSPEVGTYCNPAMLTDPTYWHINDLQVWMSDGRRDFTQGSLGMPDLNTRDKRVQNMVLDLLKECVDSGADGFRFDAAKHIETPQDDPSFASDFWPTVLNGVRSHSPRQLYIYGEILNTVGDNFSIDNYTQYMSVTDNSTGDHRREDVRYKSVGSAANSSITYDPKKTVLWAESHDTYMGGPSRYSTDAVIKQTWALVAGHKDATALFFARAYYSSQILKPDGSEVGGNTSPQVMLGDVGTMTWCDPSVSAVNHFHNYFTGQSENYFSNGMAACVVRGNSGIIISKLDGPGSVSISCGMANGTYTDQVTGNTFTVSGGTISGTVTSSDGIAVVYNRAAMPEPTASVPGGNFSTNSLSLTLGLKNASSGTYQINNGTVTPYNNGTVITIGEGLSYGTTIVVTLTATSGSTSVTVPFTYTKTQNDTPPSTQQNTGTTSPPGTLPQGDGVTVYYDNSQTNWSSVYCYVYNSDSDSYIKWPGQAMTSIGGNIYGYNIPAAYVNGKVLFSNNAGNQIPGPQEPGLNIGSQNMIYRNGTWAVYPTSPTTQQTDPPETYPSVQPATDPPETDPTSPPATDPPETDPLTQPASYPTEPSSTVTEGPKYEVSSAKAKAGGAVNLTLSIKDNPGIISLNNKIIFDENVLELVSAEDTRLLKGFRQPSPDKVSPYTLLWIDAVLPAVNNNADGVIIKLNFNVKEKTDEGNYTVSVEAIDARNTSGAKVNFANAKGTITVKNFMLGDLDGDGKVTTWDAVLFERYLAGWNVGSIELLAADIDGNGEVTTWDAVLLERYLAGWNVQYFN